MDVHGIYSKLPNELGDTPTSTSNAFIKCWLNSVVGFQRGEAPLDEKTAVFFPKYRPKKTVKPRTKTTYISRREKLKLGLLKCPKTGWKYDSFKELRELWLGYMTSYLDLCEGPPPELTSHHFAILAKADYHGAEMTIIRSKCPTLVGLSGTCVLDSKNTFRLVSPDNKCRTIPKVDSVFKIKLNQLELIIYGKYLRTRSAARSTKKVKRIMIPDL